MTQAPDPRKRPISETSADDAIQEQEKKDE